MINNRRVGKMQDQLIKTRKKNAVENDLGFILWKLESIEDFLPCYKTMMRHKEE